MKQIGVGLLSLLFLLSMFCLPTAAQDKYAIGDVTKDCKIDMRDAFQVYIWAAQGGMPEDMMELADVTQDGRFDMRDAFYLYQFPCDMSM